MKVVKVSAPMSIPAGSYKELLAYPVIALFLLPSIYWVFIDQSIWAWDESWYGSVSVDLWYTLTHNSSRWFTEMLKAFAWETGTRAPGIAWFGQFFVPIGQLVGSIETGLLLWIILAQFITLLMFFQIGQILCYKRISLSLVGVLTAAAAPLFVALGHLMYVEPIQMLGVTYFYWIAVKSVKWDKIIIIAHLLLAISISMLAKASSPLYCTLPGIFVLYQLIKWDKWSNGNSLLNLGWKIFFLVAACSLFTITLMWYVRNIGPLYSFVMSTTTGEVAEYYGRKEEFLKELQYWLSVFQKSFFTPEILIIICMALLATVGIWIVKPETKRLLTKWNSQSTLVLTAFLQTALPIIVFSMQVDEIQRFMLPVLPSLVILILGILSLNPSRLVATTLLIVLSLQWIYVNGISLGKFSPNDKISHWLRVAQTDTQNKHELERVVQVINNKQNQEHFNMVGMSLPWLNHRNLSFYTSKDRLNSGYHTYFVELGYFEKSEEIAWNRLNNFKTSYFLTLHEDAQPTPPDDLNLVSLPILERVRNDKRFVPAPFESNMGLIIFQNQEEAQTQEPALTTQEIRYHMLEAGQVFLIWGINGWQLMPEEQRPVGTFIENKVMHTPMELEGSTFVARVQAPAGAPLDYGFQIRKTQDGAAIEWVWDGDYRLISAEDDVIEVNAAVTLSQNQLPQNVANVPLVAQEIRYHSAEAGEVFLVWGINGWQIAPESIRPLGTEIKEGVMSTPMARKGNSFVARLQVPTGTTIDYGFRITKTPSSVTIDTWDADGEQDYHTVAIAENVIEVQATPHLVQRAAIGTFDIGLQWASFLVLLIGISLILGIGAVRRSRVSQNV